MTTYREELIKLVDDVKDKYKKHLKSENEYLIADVLLVKNSEATFIDKSFLDNYYKSKLEVQKTYSEWQEASNRYYNLLSHVVNNNINIDDEFSSY